MTQTPREVSIVDRPPRGDTPSLETAPAARQPSLERNAGTIDWTDEEQAADYEQPPHDDELELPFELEGTARDFGEYELQAEIARGGMGVVYRARHKRLNRVVALKMILAGQLANEDQVRRFHVEAAAAAALDHPGIVPVYEVGERRGQHFYAMAFVSGPSLASVVAHGPLASREAAHLLLNVTQAVAHAHQHGVIHRDLKPRNVLLARLSSEPAGTSRSGATRLHPVRREAGVFEPKITDFGLAKQTEGGSDLTSTGQIIGTPSYMPPEQAAGKIAAIDKRSDVYSLGAILYETLTGRPPFLAESLLETLKHVMEREPVTPRHLNPSIERDLETICLKCLQKPPDKRYQSAAELAADLQRFLNGEPIQARPVGGAERLLRWCRRKPALAAAIALSVLALVTLGVLGAVRVQLGSARLQAEANQRVADTQTYFTLVSEVRESQSNPAPGYTWAGLEKLRQAAALAVDARDPLELRSAAAALAGSVDARRAAVLAAGIRPNCLAFSRDGCWLAIAQNKSWVQVEVQVYSLADRALAHKFYFAPALSWTAQHRAQEGSTAIAFSPEGRRLLVGTRSGMVHQWDLSSHTAAHRSWQAGDDNIMGLGFSPDGENLYTATASQVRRWPGDNPTVPLMERHVEESIDSLCVAANGAVSCGGKLLFDGESLALLPAAADWPGHVTADPNGRIIAGGALNGEVCFAPIAGGERPMVMLADPALDRAHLNRVDHVAMHPQGWLLASGSLDGTVKLWDLASGRLLLTLFIGSADRVYPEFSPDGRWLAVTGDGETPLYELSGMATLSEVALQTTPIESFDVAVETDLLAVSAQGGTHDRAALSLWRRDGQWLDEWSTPRRFSASDAAPSCLSVAADGTRLAFGGERNGLIQVWDIAAPLLDPLRSVIAEPPGTLDDVRAATAEAEVGKVVALGFSPSQPLLWGCAAEDQVRSWNLPAGDERTRFNTGLSTALFGKSGVRGLAVGERVVLVGSTDGYTRVLDAVSGQALRQWTNHGGEVGCVALDEFSGLAATGTHNGSVTIADVSKGEITASLAAHHRSVTAVAIGPGGQWLARAASDLTIKLWRHEQDVFETYLALRGLPGAVRSLRFSPDGQRLYALLRGERAIRVWRLDALQDQWRALGIE